MSAEDSEGDVDCGGEELVVVDCLGSLPGAEDDSDSEDEGWYSLSRWSASTFGFHLYWPSCHHFNALKNDLRL